MLPQTSKTRHVLPMISIQDHQQLQTEDSVSALSTATLASGAIRGACLCVTAFQMVHFQIAYHTSWWSYIVQPYEMRCWWWPYFHYMQQQEGTRDCGLFGKCIYCGNGWEPPQHWLQLKQNVKAVVLGSILLALTLEVFYLFYVRMYMSQYSHTLFWIGFE